MTPLLDRNFKYFFVKLSYFVIFLYRTKSKNSEISQIHVWFTQNVMCQLIQFRVVGGGGSAVKSLDDRICKKNSMPIISSNEIMNNSLCA